MRTNSSRINLSGIASSTPEPHHIPSCSDVNGKDRQHSKGSANCHEPNIQHQTSRTMIRTTLRERLEMTPSVKISESGICQVVASHKGRSGPRPVFYFHAILLSAHRLRKVGNLLQYSNTIAVHSNGPIGPCTPLSTRQCSFHTPRQPGRRQAERFSA